MIGYLELKRGLLMSEHITKEEFERIISEGKMFKLEPEMFYGTIDDFMDCFMYDTNYESIVHFADETGCTLLEYTDEEHNKWLSGIGYKG